MINYTYHAAHRPVFSRGHGCIFDLKHLLVCFNGGEIDQNSKKLTECSMNQEEVSFTVPVETVHQYISGRHIIDWFWVYLSMCISSFLDHLGMAANVNETNTVCLSQLQKAFSQLKMMSLRPACPAKSILQSAFPGRKRTDRRREMVEHH